MSNTMSFNKRFVTFSFVVLLMVWMVVNGTEAQVTFSRDWNPGKRMLENSEFHNTMKMASSVCHLLINQIRQLAACESNNRINEDLDAASTTIFSGGR